MSTKYYLLSITFYLIVITGLFSQNSDQKTDRPDLNCVEATYKDGTLKSKGCFILEEDKSWTKHGSWLHFDKNQNMIDSINYSHGTYVGIRKTFDAKGNLIEQIDYGDNIFPRNIKHTEFFSKGATKEITTTYNQINKDSIIKHGVLTSLWKNGNLKDSIVYINGIKRTWSGYYKSGELSFTTDFGEKPEKGSAIETIEYNKDGSIRSTRKEYVGYDIDMY
ncbi:MAG: hypothetical protein C0599_15550 [Salinivirgaceae bacterium]|nr:MAG: hypothetical protein C0599_15550 [Salinivirgaceae bacterium]